jgi:hypothetical protein
MQFLLYGGRRAAPNAWLQDSCREEETGKLPRPVFFGDEGTYLRTYESDTFEQAHGIALEVEEGRATLGNAIYRDLIQASLMVDARFLVLAVPAARRPLPCAGPPPRSSGLGANRLPVHAALGNISNP